MQFVRVRGKKIRRENEISRLDLCARFAALSVCPARALCIFARTICMRRYFCVHDLVILLHNALQLLTTAYR
jgi:hypothetical protein